MLRANRRSATSRSVMKMGARIAGIGSSTLQIQGVDELGGADHMVLADRIETGTYAMAAAITGGDVMLKGARADHLDAMMLALRQAGVKVEANDTGLRISRTANRLYPINIET